MKVKLNDTIAKEIMYLHRVTGFTAEDIVNNSIRLFLSTFQKEKSKGFEKAVKEALRKARTEQVIKDNLPLLQQILAS